MTRGLSRYLLSGALIVSSACTSVSPAKAQSQPTFAEVVSACGTPNSTYAVGTNRPTTQDTTGTACSSATGGGGGGGTVTQGSPNAGGTASWFVQGADASGTATTGRPVLAGVFDGTNTRNLAGDTSG